MTANDIDMINNNLRIHSKHPLIEVAVLLWTGNSYITMSFKDMLDLKHTWTILIGHCAYNVRAIYKLKRHNIYV